MLVSSAVGLYEEYGSGLNRAGTCARNWLCEAFNLYRLPSNDRAKLPMTDAGRDVLIPANGGKNLHLDLSRKVQP